MEDRVEFNPATGQEEKYGTVNEENVIKVKPPEHSFLNRVKQWAENVKKTVGNLPPRSSTGPQRPF